MDIDFLLRLANRVRSSGPIRSSDVPGFSDRLNEALDDPFTGELGLVWVEIDASGLTADMTVRALHLNPTGFVHGGVFCSMAEAIASYGGLLQTIPNNEYVVGVSNRVEFVRRVTSGSVRAVGKAVGWGPRYMVWRVDMSSESAGGLVATALVRLRRIPFN